MTAWKVAVLVRGDWPYLPDRWSPRLGRRPQLGDAPLPLFRLRQGRSLALPMPPFPALRRAIRSLGRFAADWEHVGGTEPIDDGVPA